MRIYNNFGEALSEIKRDVAEMGIRVHPDTYQDVVVRDDPNYDTLELQNYIYTVTGAMLGDLHPTQPWADAEWQERVVGLKGVKPPNPGEAWKLRKEVWRQFLRLHGKFSYTYADRFYHHSAGDVIKELRLRPESRQLFMSVWNPIEDVLSMGGYNRIPCSLGYWFILRDGELHMTYLQRSADLVTHFENDIWMAMKLLRYVANEADLPVGNFTHWIGSLHMFKKDAEGVF